MGHGAEGRRPAAGPAPASRPRPRQQETGLAKSPRQPSRCTGRLRFTSSHRSLGGASGQVHINRAAPENHITSPPWEKSVTFL